jgi:hypothetical protein
MKIAQLILTVFAQLDDEMMSMPAPVDSSELNLMNEMTETGDDFEMEQPLSELQLTE